MMRRALIVGLDDYPDSPLSGCVNDAHRMLDILSWHDDQTRNFDCETLTSDKCQVTRAVLRKKISELFDAPADAAFFHFSGHGTVNGFGGYLVTPDHVSFDVGVPMAEVLALANASSVHEIFITLDCCHSGAFGTAPEISNDKIILREGISVITATRTGQAALEADGGGVFTTLLAEALEGAAAGLLGEVSLASVYAYIDNALSAWDQRPLFKSNVSRFTHLRKAKPKIEISLLRKIVEPEYFPLPAERLPLSPEYEPEVEPHDAKKEKIFRDLQKFHRVGLVEPIEADHMYHAAVQSKACALTALGKYYWRLVKDRKI